jgi:thioredoxin-related protein
LGAVGILATSLGIAAAQEPAKTPGPKPGTGAAKRPSIYDKTADATAQVAKAVERAKHDDKRVLLMFGGDWCGWCHKLHNLCSTNTEIARTLYNEYVLVTIDLESPNAEPLLKRCKDALAKDELQKGVGYPFLAVLDADDKVVTAQRTDPLEEGDHHDPKKVSD